MATYRYDTNFEPPIPTVKTRITAPLLAQIKHSSAVVEVTMVLDIAADISIIPKFAVKQLESKLELKLPYNQLIVVDYNGNQYRERAYELKIFPQADGFDDWRLVNFLMTDGDEGILGRDVLNNYHICFDGPSLTWTIR